MVSHWGPPPADDGTEISSGCHSGIGSELEEERGGRVFKKE